MTDKQLEQANKDLRDEMNSQGFGWINGNYIKPPTEYEMMKKKLSCVSMINSVLAYDWHGDTAEDVMIYEENSWFNYLAEYVELFGRANVVALIQEQINDIKCVKRNIYTDSEGVSYNAIIWIDD